MKKIDVRGVIIPNDYQDVYDWLGMDGTSPRKVSQELQGNEDVLININSVGGDVWSGSEIYTMLRAHKGNVEVNITGLAASAATVIAMAGDVIKMSPTSQFMIHNASTKYSGNKNEIKRTLNQLEEADRSILNAYKAKTGASEEDLTTMMDNTTWLSAEKALEMKFIDGIMFEEDKSLQLIASTADLISSEKLNEFKEMMNKETMTAHEDEAVFLLAKTQYDLLNLK